MQGDSRQVLVDMPDHDGYDLVFSCPPYADLEVYSDDPADLSAMTYPAFMQAYEAIIDAAVARLRVDRFAVWVIGGVRDRYGRYRGLVPATVRAFEATGASYYNKAILVTPVGSLPIRAGRQFNAAAKLGKPTSRSWCSARATRRQRPQPAAPSTPPGPSRKKPRPEVLKTHAHAPIVSV